MTEHRKKLVIGIDYGTTNSGVAYAVVTDPKDDNVPIEVLREWPHGKLADNIPSDIAYNENGEPIAYASDCKPEQRPLQWVKLLLEPAELGERRPGTERIWQSMQALDKLGKHPIDVVADYLRWLWSEVEKSLEESGDDIDADETVVVITLPASWSDRAKNTMLQAAQKAGIDNGRTLKFRAEPEAAAMWELKTRAKKRQVAKDDCFIVCDAGGGTVDVVSFQVLSLEPLSLDQVVVSEGDFCGSMFINAQFETQLRVLLQSDFNNLEAETKDRIRDEFEETIKRKYSPEASTEFTIPVKGLKDNDKKGIKDGRLKVSKAVLERSFDEVMAQTLVLIDGQKAGLKAKNLLENLKAILLVGGFGGSKYLHARISQEYPKNETDVKVWRGDHSWTAVVQGAVQCEVANRERYAPFNTRLSRYHYGIPYRIGDFKKVQWLIHKGEDVRDTSHNEPYVLRMEHRDWLDIEKYVTIRVTLVKTDKDEVTEDLDSSLEPHVEIHCRVPTAIRYSEKAKLIQDNPKVWQIPAELILAMDGPLLTVRCRIQGKDVGLLDLKYHDEENFPSHGLSAVQTMVEPERATPRTTSPWPLPTRASQISHESHTSQVSQTSQASQTSHSSSQSRNSRPDQDAANTALASLTSTPSSSHNGVNTNEKVVPHYLNMSGASPTITQEALSRVSTSPTSEFPGPLSPGDKKDSRQSSTSPKPRISLSSLLKSPKSEEEKAAKEKEKLEKERLAAEEKERKKQEKQRRESKKGSDLWVPFTSANGKDMLRNQATNQVVPAPSKEAHGYGLH